MTTAASRSATGKSSPTAPMQALHEPHRGHTTLIYLDAVEPKSELLQPATPITRLPDMIELDYDVQPRFQTAPAQADACRATSSSTLDLPVTTPPVQVPRIASAGMALSQVRSAAHDYSATEARRKFLWLEFAEPIADPHDNYFIRFLGYAPDPLLSDDRIETFTPPEETPLPIDPELIRVIAPGATDDHAGLTAMTPLTCGGQQRRPFPGAAASGMNQRQPGVVWLLHVRAARRAMQTSGRRHRAGSAARSASPACSIRRRRCSAPASGPRTDSSSKRRMRWPC